jgi:hypothetical protein
MIGGFRIEGHAIVSRDDHIADAGGAMPPGLRNGADWQLFQAALERAAIVVLGRRSHMAAPNPAGRTRLVLSTGVAGIERRSDAWWWNPAEMNATEALARAAPGGGTAAVVGGRGVFDLFLTLGFDAFHLARAAQIALPGGVPVFSDIANGRTAGDVLAAAGLMAEAPRELDAAAGVTLVTWAAATA